MRKIIFFGLSLASIAPSAPAADLAGAYDLGPRAAAMILRHDTDETSAPIGVLTFCKRKTLLDDGRCTGVAMPIRCHVSDASWVCEEGGNYPFRAVITALDSERVRYDFKSSFNEGTLEGKRLPIEVESRLQ